MGNTGECVKQMLADVFYKRPDSKYFRHWPYIVFIFVYQKKEFVNLDLKEFRLLHF